MTTYIRLSGTSAQLVSSSSSGAPAQVAFSSRLQAAFQSPAVASGVTGRQVIAEALKGLPRPRSLATIAAGIVGGPLGMLANVAGGAKDQTDLLDLLDKTKQILMTNAIFDTANAPKVERELETF